jgi:hypothetical protein
LQGNIDSLPEYVRPNIARQQIADVPQRYHPGQVARSSSASQWVACSRLSSASWMQRTPAGLQKGAMIKREQVAKSRKLRKCVISIATSLCEPDRDNYPIAQG